MKHSAKYLDSGFYIISDRAAGDLCRIIGHKLPALGRSKFVMLQTGEHKMNAWLQRTDTCLLKRKWHWALHALRPDGRSSSYVSALGKEFTFEPIKSTQTVTA